MSILLRVETHIHPIINGIFFIFNIAKKSNFETESIF